MNAASAGVVDLEFSIRELFGDFGVDAVAADEELAFDGFGAVGEDGVYAGGGEFVACDAVGPADVGFAACEEVFAHVAAGDADDFAVA